MSTKIILENKSIKAEFDCDTGALCGLSYKTTGWKIHRRPELAESFELLIPVPGKRHNIVAGINQHKPDTEQPDDNTVVFHWNKLNSMNADNLAIDFAGKVELTDEGLVFSAEIKNNSPYTIEVVSWPVIADFSMPENCEKMENMSLHYGGGRRMSVYPFFTNDAGYFGAMHPRQHVLSRESQFIVLADKQQGFYLGYHDNSMQQMVELAAELRPGAASENGGIGGIWPAKDNIAGKPVHMRTMINHFPYVTPGKQKQLGKRRRVMLNCPKKRRRQCQAVLNRLGKS